MELTGLIQKELSRFRVEEAAQACKKCMINPTPEIRTCPFTGEPVDIKVVANLSPVQVMAYRRLENGHRWGLLMPNEDDLQTSNYWYSSVEDAFYNSMAWRGELPLDYTIET